MKILFTGASSFTGYWFVRQLTANGHEVVATFQKPALAYDGIRAQRVSLIKGLCETRFECSFGSDAFMHLVGQEASWDLLCHHAADVTDYKSPHFDVMTALKHNVHNLSTVLEALKGKGCTKMLLTGSVFEQNEGLGTDPERAFSPYGLSKGLTSDYIRYYCHAQGVALGKFVIPNPFGPFEEPRLTNYLVHTWANGQRAAIKTPEYIRDNIHVSLLALAYANFAEQIDPKTLFTQLSPSGYVESQGAFVNRFAEAMRPRLGLSCEVELHPQESFPEPHMRINSQPVNGRALGWNEDRAWHDIAAYYRELLGVEANTKS